MQAWDEFVELMKWLLTRLIAGVFMALFLGLFYIPIYFILKYW